MSACDCECWDCCGDGIDRTRRRRNRPACVHKIMTIIRACTTLGGRIPTTPLHILCVERPASGRRSTHETSDESLMEIGKGQTSNLYTMWLSVTHLRIRICDSGPATMGTCLRKAQPGGELASADIPDYFVIILWINSCSKAITRAPRVNGISTFITRHNHLRVFDQHVGQLDTHQ